MAETGVFSFNEEIPSIASFQYGTEPNGTESKLFNSRLREDGVTLHDFVSDINLSEKYTSDGKNIGEVLSNWIKE